MSALEKLCDRFSCLNHSLYYAKPSFVQMSIGTLITVFALYFASILLSRIGIDGSIVKYVCYGIGTFFFFIIVNGLVFSSRCDEIPAFTKRAFFYAIPAIAFLAYAEFLNTCVNSSCPGM